MPTILTGIVSSVKNSKTITVVTHGHKTHPIYKKKYSVSKKFLVHDEKNEAEVGDRVSFIETRPISRHKHFKLEKIIEKPRLREEALSVTKVEEAAKRPESKAKTPKEEKVVVKEVK